MCVDVSGRSLSVGVYVDVTGRGVSVCRGVVTVGMSSVCVEV